jgi:diguanylate cyclase (GGDEF)-like protein/PAS domain S-box-containing protein
MYKRHFLYSFTLILLLIAAVAGWFVTDYLGNKARQEIIEESRASSLTLSIYVSSTLNKFKEAVKSMAGSPWIAPALLSKRDRDIEHANSALDRYNSALNASVSYLMNAEGMTVASSNRNDPDSFVGKSYRFRPYFQEAFRGNPSRYYALGVTSGKRGFYASYPVQNRLGKVVGVVTIKKDLDDMETFFSKYPFCFFISPDGIIFLSSTPAMVLKSFWLLDKTAQEKLIASRQFGNKPFEAVFSKNEIADGAEITLEGNAYLVSRKMIASDGWSIVLLTPTNRIGAYKLIGILTTISICLLILISTGVIYATNRSKEAIRQSEESKRLLLHSAGEGIFGVDAAGQMTFINPAALLMLGFTEEELFGQRVHNLIHHTRADGSNYPVEDCPMYASYTKAADCRVTDELLWRKDGSSFPVEYSSMPITRDDKVIGAVVTFKDITERKRAEQEIDVLAEIGRVIGSTLDIDNVYERFAVESRKLIHFDSLIVNLNKPREDTLCVAYASGADIPERRKGDSFPLKGSVSEVAMRTGTGLIVRRADMLKGPDPFSAIAINLQAGLYSMMNAPLISRGEAIGALVFRAEKPDAYTEQDLRLAERIGMQIAGAIANAQLYAGLKEAEQELKESEQRYRQLSIIDDLTQLYNSRHFYFQLKIELNRSNRYEQPLTILMLDIDNFKAFNDTYGHVEGDQVLSRLGHVIKRSLRETDFAFRYGGEEFTILLPMTTNADGAVTAERIRTEFKKETFSPVPGQDVHVTVSIGLAQYKPQEEMKVFVHRVDQLMYQGKKNGKDRICSES